MDQEDDVQGATASRPDWLAPLSDPRNEAILFAAFDVFREKGFTGATMLDVATRAKVSKETLYARFDSKDGLFYALLAWGARQSALDPESYGAAHLLDPVTALEDLAVACLRKMMQPESLEVTRVAHGEAMRGGLGVVFHEQVCFAVNEILPKIAEALLTKGHVRVSDYSVFRDAFIGLLKGDRHQRALLGVDPPPDEAAIVADARRAVRLLLKAFA
jgi:AcrR family transcriptional regulator